MLIDSRLEFSDAQTVAGTAGTAIVGTNQVDTSAISRDFGNGQPIYLVVTVDTSIVAAGAGTLVMDLVSDSATNLTTSPVIHASKALTTAASATDANKTTAGSLAWVIQLPSGVSYKQYLGIKFTPTTQNTSAGKVNAFLTQNAANWVAYSDQF